MGHGPRPPATAPARYLATDFSGDGRFLPGTIFASRYRILGLLGRGGMGEVYRADDLKLGQAVALKFLPASVENDAARLQRFLNEVRIARQISHPNVCRVYDVGDADGQHYLSMEYVDGEDLASLLRRIGCLPRDKAAQISREICMGLAAAHEQGVLHRDLKPANVMIDGRGRAKIADFGLATIAGELGPSSPRAGTPAYMAPEQRAGNEVTVRSDIYSLGLVLYELTTGRLPSAAESGDEPTRNRDASTPAPPSSLEGLWGPEAERAIRRCLQRDSALRPTSALTVAAALPGVDPLTAALAAGDTPSPRMVADAVSPGALSPLAAWTCLLASVTLAVLTILAHGSLQHLLLVPLERSPDVLADRARETIQHFGYSNLPFESDGFDWNDPYLDHVAANDASAGRWERLRNGQPAAIRFWFRASPVGLAPANPATPVTAYDDPPFTAPGMVGVWLDTKGRLLRLDAVPRSYLPAARDSGEYPATRWASLFEAAGLPFEAFHPVPPEWSPVAFADERLAWDGVYPDAPDVPIRVEAAAFAGQPVSFRIVEPWMTLQDTHESARSLASNAMSIAEIVLRILVLIAAALLAARNMRRGRSDPRGAFRLSMYFLAIWMLCGILGRHPFAGTTSIAVFFGYLAWGIYRSVVVWLAYVAIEPYLRRLWPRTMISWARALEGRWRDPLVGRDVLLGAVSAGVLWLAMLSPYLIARWRGMPMPAHSLGHDASGMYSLGRFLPSLSPMLLLHAGVLLNAGFLLIVLVVLLRLITRKTWISVLACVPLIIAFNLNGEADRLAFLVFGVLWLLILFRFGVLCLMTVLGLLGLQLPVPATLSTSAWYGGPSWVFLALFVAVAVYGFIVSLGGQLAFGKVLAEE